MCPDLFRLTEDKITETIILDPGIETDLTSYWAMLYLSIINTIKHQKNIKYRFSQGSLDRYKGDIKNPSNFFHTMKQNIKNHGIEYLSIDFLKSKHGYCIFKDLIDRLLKKQGISDFELSYFNILKLGVDSDLYDEYEKANDIDIEVLTLNKGISFLGNKNICQRFTYPIVNIAKTFRDSDLLIIIADKKMHRTYGFVGEVEGLHGEKLLNENYWLSNKGKYTTFGIGSSDRKKIGQVKAKENIIFHKDSCDRIILNFSNSNFLIKDFYLAINNFDLMLDGKYTTVLESTTDDNHINIINLIVNYWSKESSDLIYILEQLINYHYADNNKYYFCDESKIFKPSLLVLENNYFLHKIDNDESTQ